jgi:hypothetical protein
MPASPGIQAVLSDYLANVAVDYCLIHDVDAL